MNNNTNPTGVRLTPTATLILKQLLAAVESTSTHGDGSKWGTVYLDNASRGVKPRTFSAICSQLQKAGLYLKETDPDYRGIFGYVRIFQGQIVGYDPEEYDDVDGKLVKRPLEAQK